MKKTLLFLISLLCSFNALAQSVIYDPEGEDVTYKLECVTVSNFYSYGTYLTAAHIRYAADGTTCYIQDITPSLKLGSWVRGEIEGDIITIPTNQVIYAGVDENNVAFQLLFKAMDIDLTTGVQTDLDAFTLRISGDHIKATSSSEFAVAYEEGNGAYEYTYGHDYSPHTGLITIDDIITDPQGETTYYSMTCDIYSLTQNNRYGSMKTKVVYGENNMVYINSMLPGYGKVWVRGTINGDKISIPSYQAVEYLENTDETIYFATYIGNEYSDEPYELRIEGDRLVSVNDDVWTAAVPITEGIINLPFAFSWSYDMNRVDEEQVVMPEGISKIEYTLTAVTSTDSNRSLDATIGIDGNDVYITGLLQNTPSVVIKGEKNGNEIHIPSRQLLGDDNYYYRFMAGRRNGQSYTFMDELVLTLEDGWNKITSMAGDYSLTCYEDAQTVLKAWNNFVFTSKNPSCINDVDSTNSYAPMFDLQGRRVLNAGKGIFVKNGKKFVNR